MKILVTICARAGSKGVKSKNVRDFLGKPLYYYTLAAIERWRTTLTDDIEITCAVNTDSTVLSNGIKTLMGDSYLLLPRPKELAGDVVSKWEVLRYSLQSAEETTGNHYDFLLDLDVTSPLRSVKDVQAVIEKAQESLADVVFSVTESRRNPYFNMVKCENGVFSKVIDSNYTARQQAPIVYDMNASIYCVRCEFLVNKKNKNVFSGRFDVVHMRDTAVLDLDSENDYQLMQVIANYLSGVDDGIREIMETAWSYPA